MVRGSSIEVRWPGGAATFAPGTNVTIGRDDTSDVVSTNPHVSRHHAALSDATGRWVLTDARSTQGVFVDGVRIAEAVVDGVTVVVLGRPELGDRVELVEIAPLRPSEMPTMIPEVARGGASTWAPIVARPLLRVEVEGRTEIVRGDAPVSIGRDESSTIAVVNASVSRRHAVIEPVGDGWELVDVGSRLGTFVDGRGIDRIGISGDLEVWLGGEPGGARLRITFDPDSTAFLQERAATALIVGDDTTAGPRVVGSAGPGDALIAAPVPEAMTELAPRPQVPAHIAVQRRRFRVALALIVVIAGAIGAAAIVAKQRDDPATREPLPVVHPLEIEIDG